MTDDFGGKVAIVTGAAGGIGRVILGRFAEAGARVVLADVDVEHGAAIAKDVGSRGGDALFVRTDVRESAQVDAMVGGAFERFGRVDILVHGAGVGVHKEIVDLSEQEWDLQVDVQLGVGVCVIGEVIEPLL